MDVWIDEWTDGWIDGWMVAGMEVLVACVILVGGAGFLWGMDEWI